MRLAILAHNLRVAGGLVVARNIIASLPRIAPQHDYLMIVPANADLDGVAQTPRLRHVPVCFESLVDRWRVDTQVIPRLLRDFAPDWVWALGNVPARGTGSRQALLVMDPHLFYPARHYMLETTRNRARKYLLRRHIARSLRDVDVVFCQTESARRRFAAQFDFRGRIEICPAAVSEFVGRPVTTEVPALLRERPAEFKLLVMTRYYAHKNIERLVEAFDRFRDELAGVVCVLTIAADEHPGAARLLGSIRDLGLGDRFVNLGPLRQEELAAAYLACDGLLHPTLLESFSSAYLEAMHFDRPILTSDLDFAREVCGDAAAYFDPWTAQGIRDGIVRFRDDPDERARLVERGRERLSRSIRTWPAIVRDALAVLEDDERDHAQEEVGKQCRYAPIRAGAAS